MKIKTTIILLFIWTIFHPDANAQFRYSLIYDKTGSSIAGAKNLFTLHKAIYSFTDDILPVQLHDENTFIKKIPGIGYRIFKTAIIDFQIDYLTSIIQHQIFGHGAKMREYGLTENLHHVEPFFPFGDGSAYSKPGNNTGNRKKSDHENLIEAYYGSIATQDLSNEITAKWLLSGKIHYREASLYLISTNDISTVILTGWLVKKGKLKKPFGSDGLNYIYQLNIIEGYSSSNPKYTIEDLAKSTGINLLNSFQYLALYSYLKTYLFDGKEELHTPTIKIKKTGYIPAFRMGLSPFGAEYYFDNYILLNNRLVKAYFRYGNPAFHNFLGGGVHVFNLLQRSKMDLNVSLHIWDQPGLNIGGNNIRRSNRGIGGLCSFDLFLKLINKSYPVNILLTLGYKTDGYIEGEYTANGFVIRGGLAVDINKM